RDVIAQDIGDPNVVPLVDGEREGKQQLAWILERIATGVVAQNLTLRGIALGYMNQLGAHRIGGPDVATGRDNDALHVGEPAAEVPALGGRKRRAVLVEQ